jgi:hypothetical protein
MQLHGRFAAQVSRDPLGAHGLHARHLEALNGQGRGYRLWVGSRVRFFSGSVAMETRCCQTRTRLGWRRALAGSQ